MAGKVIKDANLKHLKAMHTAIAAVMESQGLSCDGTAIAESLRARLAPSPEQLALVEALLRKSQSQNALRGQLGDALRLALNTDMYGGQVTGEDRCYPYIVDVYPDSIIYSIGYGDDSGLFQAAYNIDNTGSSPVISFGEPIAVEVCYSPVGGADDDLGEAGQVEIDEPFVKLLEAKIPASGIIPIKVIDAGWGSKGYYGADMLKRDGPAAFPAGTKMYLDHPTPTEESERPERSVRDLAAVLTTPAAWSLGPDGPGLYAQARVYDVHREAIASIAGDIGLSIRGLGRAVLGEAEGRKGPIIQSINKGLSVDFVTDAGRGGKILALAESRRATPPKPTGDQDVAVSDEQFAQLMESMQQLTGTVATLTAAQANQTIMAEAQRVATARLAPHKLPAPAMARLVESLAASPVKTEAGGLDLVAFGEACDNAARAELAYIQQLTGGGRVIGLGESWAPAVDTDRDADAASVAASEASLTESMAAFGLSPESAALAGKGRV